MLVVQTEEKGKVGISEKTKTALTFASIPNSSSIFSTDCFTSNTNKKYILLCTKRN